MSAHQLMPLLAPTTILLLIIFIIVHDRLVDQRMKKFASKSTHEAKPPSAKQQVLATLSTLSDSTPMNEILVALRQAWASEVPASVRDMAIVTLGDESRAVHWLTSRQHSLNNAIPAEIARIEPGERLVLQVLDRLGTRQ